MTVPPDVRHLAATDRAAWERLYAGYAEFYKATQTPDMRQTVWSWIMDPAHPVQALVATSADGTLLGLAHFRAFSRPLSASTGGYLDDLFVDPEQRGSGAADALLAAIAAEGGRQSWTVIRWITAEDNYRARGVYDRRAERTKWVTYDIKL